MSSIPETDPEDLKLFIAEADEQLQLLDETIVKMETEGADASLLQEIFRAAHTLKGSSAMLGYEKMTHLAHAMENLLDLVRNGELPVTTPLVDGLLHGLDGLTALKDDLVEGRDSNIDIAPTVAELEELAGGQDESFQDADSGNGAVSQAVALTLVLDEAAVEKAQSPRQDGEHVYKVEVHFTQDSPFLSIRSFQVLGEVSNLGETLASSPSQAEIEQEKAGPLMQVVLLTTTDPDVIKTAVESVEDVLNAEIGDYTYEPPSEVAEPEPVVKVVVAHKPVVATKRGSGPPKAVKASQTVRIDVERLDNLMNAIGELVIDRTRMVQINRVLEDRFKGDPTIADLGSTFAHTSRLIGDIQEEVMKARMVPIGTVFNSLPRMIRDLSQSLGKPLEFTMGGQETEIDRTVVESIRDPLVHLLRNGLDHGLETPDERRSAGKPEKGSLKLSAYQEQGQIIITVIDDGKGIDPERIKASAVKKGLYSEEAVARMSDSEAIDLIFAPGMSTKEETTEVSGRGVGMDIVKTNIEKVRGSIGVETEIGTGSKFIIKLPLTLAIIQGILVKANDAVYAIPLVYILQTFKINRDEVHIIAGSEVVRLRESVYPLLDLSSLVNDANLLATEKKSAYAVLVRQGDRSVALGVDALLEPQEVVVKSLGSYMGNVKGISGASILGDGQVVLILDIPTMVTMTSPSAVAVAV